MTLSRSLFVILAGIAFIIFLVCLYADNRLLWQASLVAAATSLAIGLGGLPTLAGYQFTAWIVAAVIAAMCYPDYFLYIGPFDLGALQVPSIDLRNKWLILAVVQLVMFGMGTKMRLHDFVGVAKMPYPVFIGVGLQFLIMPLTGYALTKVFGFPPEIAVGVILIGSCSSGLASNVMCYLAGADLPLSVTLTAVGTLLSPLLTPFWIYLLAGDTVRAMLAGESVKMDFVAMMTEIIRIVLLPIGAALLHDVLLRSSLPVRRLIFAVAATCLLYMIFLATGGWGRLAGALPLSMLENSAMLAAGILVGVTFHLAAIRSPWIEHKVHLVSMVGIMYFTAVTTAAGRENLLNIGIALLAAAILHNLIGWILGYWMSLLAGLDRSKAITVGFEVAMQNGGLATGLASAMGKLGTVGLAAAVFSPWMNVSGSVIANLIRRYAPIEDAKAKTSTP